VEEPHPSARFTRALVSGPLFRRDSRRGMNPRPTENQRLTRPALLCHPDPECNNLLCHPDPECNNLLCHSDPECNEEEGSQVGLALSFPLTAWNYLVASSHAW
jgi:hypothetical protein